MGRHPVGHKLNYISGITLANAKKFFKFHFKEFYHSAKGDPTKWRYDIYVLDKIKLPEEGKLVTYLLDECYDLEEFKEYWGNGFRVVVVEYKDAK